MQSFCHTKRDESKLSSLRKQQPSLLSAQITTETMRDHAQYLHLRASSCYSEHRLIRKRNVFFGCNSFQQLVVSFTCCALARLSPMARHINVVTAAFSERSPKTKLPDLTHAVARATAA